MADYRRRSKKEEKKEPEEVQQVQAPQNMEGFDMNKFADLLSEKMSKNLNFSSQSGIIVKSGSQEDDFDDTKSLDMLASNMHVERSNKSSNFDGLGGVKETKKDNDQTDNTVDFLSDLED